MGAVYKARDREIDHLVALKVIRPELAVHPEILRRFKQELILARQVTHKNVIRIFDLGDADGVKFITMEFVEGQDLKSLVAAKGKLSVDEAVRVIEQVCHALGAAHGEGVVHRDLKPQNIMIDRHGKVSVMDFGIARSTEMGGMTQTGMLMGTPDYMSPEQVMGEHVDARSDLFAIGVIFYELLTGNMPYKGETLQSAMFKRTRERPLPPIEVDPTIPPFLSQIAAKCLEIDPNLRYQSAGEILQDLESWRGGGARTAASSAKRPSLLGSWMKWSAAGVTVFVLIIFLTISVIIGAFLFRQRLFARFAPAQDQAGLSVSLAILPFQNASGDHTLDWLGSSMAEMLNTDVGQSSHLRTVSPERVGQILQDMRISPNTSLDAPTVRRVAEFSNADTVVWGQYAKFGDQIRIDATIRDLKRGNTTTVETVAATEKDILGAVNHLAGDIRQNLSLSRSMVEELQAQPFKPSSTSMPALHDYNEGLDLARQGNYLDASKKFEASATEDPGFALAYSELAQSYENLGQDDEAEQASQKAVERSDKLPDREKYLVLARHDEILSDYPKAIDSYENLTRLAPRDADVLLDLGRLQEKSGSFDKARESFSKALTLDPKRVDGLLAMGRVEIESGDAQSGLDFLNKAQSMAIELGNDEEKAQILQAIGVAYTVLNKQEDALRNYQESLEIKRRLGLKKGIADSLQAIAQTEDSLGHPDAALKGYSETLQLRKDIGDKAGTGDVENDLAQFYDGHGQYDQALKMFKESLQIQTDVGNETNQALALNNIGDIYRLQGDYQDAQTYFSQALALREKLNVPSDIADTVHNLADISMKTAHFDQALTQYLRALDLRRNAGDKRGAAIESSSLGILFGYQGRFGAAVSSEEDALKTLREIHERGFWLVEITSQYGRALAEIGRSDDARKNLDEALTQARDLKSQAQIAQTLSYQADNFYYQGDFKSAAVEYEEALQEASRTSDRQSILLAKMNLAKMAMKQGSYQNAGGTLRGLCEEADTLGLKYLSVECSVYLGEALLDNKNYAPARQELQRALNNSEKLGLNSLLAQSAYLLARSLQLTGNAGEATSHYNEARQLVGEIRKEAGSDSVMKRSDLSPIYALAVR